MCDNALMSGFALDRPVDGHIVREVCRDFDLGVAPPFTPARASHLSLVTPEGSEPEADDRTAGVAGESAETRRRRQAVESRGSSVSGRR
jgi:hypothetical protein